MRGVMLTLAAWLHDWSPFVWRISPSFGIRWYGLAYVAGFIAAWMILARLARRGRIIIPADRIGDFILGVVVGTILGGRLGYALIYNRALFTELLPGPPWWGLLAINQGGMASHGGMAGIVLACLILARRWKLPALHLTDCLARVAPVGIFFGRLANFVNGELLGAPVSPPGAPGPWWAVKFPQELLERQTDEQIEMLARAAPELAEVAASGSTTNDSAIAATIHQLQHGSADAARLLEPLLYARHPSQLYQAIAEGVFLGLALWWIARRPAARDRHGLITAWFFILYGIGRIITEVWRLPDAQFGDAGRIAGLSRGQWLSAGLIVAGIGLLWRRTRTRRDSTAAARPAA